MIASGITLDKIQDVGRKLNINVIPNRPRTGFLLRPQGDHFRALSPHGRRVSRVCQHGYLRFFTELFTQAEHDNLHLVVSTHWFTGAVSYRCLADMRRYIAASREYQQFAGSESCLCG